jgi:hypothetical protein
MVEQFDAEQTTHIFLVYFSYIFRYIKLLFLHIIRLFYRQVSYYVSHTKWIHDDNVNVRYTPNKGANTNRKSANETIV